MGTCALFKNKVKWKNFPKPTQDDQQDTTKGLLRFDIELKNVYIELKKGQKVSVDFRFGEGKLFSTTQFQIQSNHLVKYPKSIDNKWPQIYQDKLTMTEQQLRTNLLNVLVSSEQVVIYKSIELTLYEVVTGPSKFDLPLYNQQFAQRGRVKFELKLQQVLRMDIDILALSCNFYEPLADPAYNFNVRLITHELSFSSSHSSTFKNPDYYTKREQEEEKLSSRPSDIRSDPRQMQLRLGWDKNKLLEDPVGLNVQLPYRSLQTSSLQILIWSLEIVNKTIPSNTRNNHILYTQEQNDEEYVQMKINNHHLLAETYISIMDLISDEANQLVIHNLQYQIDSNQQIYNTYIDKELWYNGKQTGVIGCEFQIFIPNYLKQMVYGIRNENGVDKGKLMIYDAQYTQVNEINALMQTFKQLTGYVEIPEEKLSNRLGFKNEIKNTMKQLYTLLSSPEGDQMKCFHYKSPNDLLTAQTILVKISVLLIQFREFFKKIDKELFYNSLIQVSTRGELQLEMIGLKQPDGKTINNQKKLKLCLQYQELLYSTLKIVFDKTAQKDLLQKQKEFIGLTLAQAYYRIPEFRRDILNVFMKFNQMMLFEWKSTDFSLHVEDAPLPEFMNWDQAFHIPLTVLPKSFLNKNLLNQILEQNEWKERFSQGDTFHFFVQSWMKYTKQYISITRPWQSIPGYRLILKGVLSDIKNTQLKVIPQTVEDSLKSMILNPRLLETIISLLVKKTSIFQSDCVVSVLQLLNELLQETQRLYQTLPTNFDYVTFFNAIRIILVNCEHAQIIQTCLWMIYNNFPLFMMDHRKVCCEILMEQAGHKLFAHWSQQVRFMYLHVLIYRIYHLHRANRALKAEEENMVREINIRQSPKRQQSYYESREQHDTFVSNYIFIKFQDFMRQLEAEKRSYIKKESLNLDADPIQKMRNKLMARVNDEGKVQKIRTTKFSSLSGRTSEELILQTKGAFTTKRLKATQEQNKLHLFGKEDQQGELSYSKLYLKTAFTELDKIMKDYNMWRDGHIHLALRLRHANKNNPVQPDIFTSPLAFKVPRLVVVQRLDAKERQFVDEVN